MKNYVLPIGIVNDGFPTADGEVRLRLFGGDFLSDVVHFKAIELEETDEQFGCFEVSVVMGIFLIDGTFHLFILYEGDDHQKQGVTAESPMVGGE